MVAEKTLSAKTSSIKKRQTIPDYLICEVMDGQPLYYKGYKDVLSKKKKIEDIMGSSTLQGLITGYIAILFGRYHLDEKYELVNNEAGLHLDKNDNLAGDITIYDPNILTADKVNKHYASVPPKIVIEVDIMIEMENFRDVQYMRKKVDKLHAFGTEKVFWILTASRQVVVATNGQPWLTHDWNDEIELLDGVSFNIGKYLNGKGIVVED